MTYTLWGDNKCGEDSYKGSFQTLQQAINKAKKSLIKIKFDGTTIPVDADAKFGSAKVIIKPAKEGKGLVAGGAMRIVLDYVGLKDVTAKMLGSNNKLNNARATVKALAKTI